MSKISRKKLLKEPDEFLTFSERAVEWAQHNYRVIIAVVAAAILVVAGVVGAGAYLDYREQEAARALNQTFADYQAAVEGTADKSELEAADQKLKKVVEDYGSTPAGVQARLALGDLLLEKGRYEEAEPVMAGLAEEKELPAELMALAWHGLGVSREGQKKYAEAGKAYGRAMELAGPTLGLTYTMDQARSLEAAGDKAGAVALYRRIIAKAGEGPAQSQAQTTELAQARLVALGEDPSAE